MNSPELLKTISVPMDDGAEIAVFIYGPSELAESVDALQFGPNSSKCESEESLSLGVLCDASPIVMLHGNGESHENMMELIEGAADDQIVVALDSRGHGASKRGRHALSYERMAKDVFAILDYLGLTKVHLMGFSDGGIVALKVALSSLEPLLSMTIMGTNLEPNGLLENFTSKIAAELSLLEGSTLEDEDPDKYSQVELYSLMLNAPHIRPEKLKAIDIPVAVMAGEHDLVRLEETYRIAEALPNCSLTIVEGATHDLPNDAPDRVLEEAAVVVAEGEELKLRS